MHLIRPWMYYYSFYLHDLHSFNAVVLCVHVEDEVHEVTCKMIVGWSM